MNNRLLRELEHDSKIAAKAEDIWRWSSPAGQMRAKRRAALISEYAGIDSSKHVLEIGCGTGLFTNVLSKHVASIVALDLSTGLLKKISDNKSIFPLASIAEKLPFANETFDAVVGSSVLHHLAIKPALIEIWRVLKTGGSIAFAEPNMANPQILIQKNIPWIKARMGDSPDETAFFRWQMMSLLKSAKFHSCVVLPYDFLHPATPSQWIPKVSKWGLMLEHTFLLREFAGSLIIGATK